MPSREWLDEQVTVSREEFGHIIASNIADIMNVADGVCTDSELNDLIKNLLMEFSASVAVDLFEKDELEVE